MLKDFDTWHKTKRGYAITATVELIVAYILFSFSVDNGSLLFYIATLLFFIGAISNFIKLISLYKTKHAPKSRTKKA